MAIVRTSEAAHAGLQRLAQRRHRSMAAVLEELVERAETEEFWGSLGRYWEETPGYLDDDEIKSWMETPAPEPADTEAEQA
ncbi:hypothetical protein ACTWPT_25005 [Nonomuraea sp. 3N208]|uniref:hypothetical protein n=1 Tax=Nonomuraea sp. 3N208 TaxID=3457421 RepID=UPI003FD672FA